MKLKVPTTYDEQVDIIRSRGIDIDDLELCHRVLNHVSYYRLTAYFLPFKHGDGTYDKGTKFSRAYRIYEFDRKLRHILLSALEQIEIFLRSQIGYYHAHKYGADGYMNKDNFTESHKHDRFIATFEREVESNKMTPVVMHHKEKYDGCFPLWVATELFSFGMLSRFYCDMKTPDQKAIARELYGVPCVVVQSWLRCCTDLRNICAHHGRLYYRIFTSIPAGFNLQKNERRRLWAAVLALRGLYPYADNWNAEVLPSIVALFDEYNDAIELKHIAFPKDWAEQLKK